MIDSIILPPLFISILLLLVRIVVAISFFFSALNKAKNPTASAKQNGIPLPLLLFITIAEFAGALGIVSGVLAQYAALGLMLLMLGTISIHIFVWKSKYWASKGGWEYDLMLLCLCGVITVFGTGSISL
jgi:putative oxidoreductase